MSAKIWDFLNNDISNIYSCNKYAPDKMLVINMHILFVLKISKFFCYSTFIQQIIFISSRHLISLLSAAHRSLHARFWLELPEKKVQGDTSGGFQPTVDIRTKVAFQYMLLILKHNFCFYVNMRLGTTWCVTL